MKPVNLIPPEDRRGDHAPLRAGSLSYVVIGAVAAVLIAVVALVLTQNSITEHENEIAELEVAEEAATQRAQALAPYAEFASLQQQRESTIASLADSRFDWERVLRELAIVIPAGVSLENLEASTAGGSEESSTAVASGAPSLLLAGCAPNHDVVAEFVAALEDIDGVTRVGLENSIARGEEDTGATTTENPGCGLDPEIADFSITAVFDGVVVTADPAAGGATAPTPAPTDPAAAQQTATAGDNSTTEQVSEANQAVDVVTGTAR